MTVERKFQESVLLVLPAHFSLAAGIMPTMVQQQKQRWCYTLNNYTEEDVARLHNVECRYHCFGKEIGENGTPHLQGFIIFNRSIFFNAAKRLISERCHLESTVASNEAASTYCKKEGQYFEKGTFAAQGKRSDWDRYTDWVRELGRLPTERELIQHNCSLFARYQKKCYAIAKAFLPVPNLINDSAPRDGWQQRVSGLVQEGIPAPRSIYFVVDPLGSSGKSWMCRWALSKFPDLVQVLRIGKRDDLSYCIDETKKVFLFDVPREQMTYLQYSVLESLKDQMIFSPKYESALKILMHPCQVIVFSNEYPNETQLTADRFEIIEV